jgi:hypothetical protein
MTTDTLPEIRQTLPGRSRPYRLFTVEHCAWGDYPSNRTVTCDRWGVSYSQQYDENWERTGLVELRVYDVSRMPEEDIEYHALHGTTYATSEDAKRAAFEAGVLAYMVYVD